MKRLLPILLFLCLLLTPVSCAGKTPPAADEPTAATNTATTGETGAGPAEAYAPADTEETDTIETTAEETEAETDAAPAIITLTWAEDYNGNLEALTACSAVDDPQTAFVISTDRAVSGLRILSLYEANFSNNGHYTFSHDAVYSQDTLAPDAPLLVNTTFYGDTPNIGIRYIDADGSERLYAIDVSGMDGSLYLLTFEGGGAG